MRTRIKAAIAAASSVALIGAGVGIGSAVAASSSPVAAKSNLYGCVTGPNRTLEGVYTIEQNFINAGGCQSTVGGFPVTVGDQPVPAPTTPTPTPTQTTPTPTPTPTTPTPTPTATGAACVTSEYDHSAQCDFPISPKITGTQANHNPWVSQDVWNPVAGGTQTLTANSPSNWHVVAQVPANHDSDGGIVSFPDTGFWMGAAPTAAPWVGTTPVDSYSSITSSWNVTIPADPNVSAGWGAYDLWLNNWADEVMIRTAVVAPPAYYTAPVATATFDGQPWNLTVFGSERVWSPGSDDAHLRPMTTGTVDVKAMLVWLEQHGYLKAGSAWTQGSFGFEIARTNGTQQTFAVNDFSWTATGGAT
jgi:hypothetical protein